MKAAQAQEQAQEKETEVPSRNSNQDNSTINTAARNAYETAKNQLQGPTANEYQFSLQI